VASMTAMSRRYLRAISGPEPFISAVALPPAEEGAPRSGYPWELAAVRALDAGPLRLHPRVTYLVGENGSGKSTLLEAIAVAAGMNPEGGSSGFRFSTRESHSPLGDELRLHRGARRPRTDFFLRAESLFTAGTYLEELPDDPLAAYGGVSLHEQSHGESFLAVLLNRFGPNGLYILDEPEAALSTQNCLTFLARVHQLVGDGCQLVIATHSPLVLAYPDAVIYACEPDGVREIDYEDADPVRLTRSFLEARERFLRELLA
jgi:predicted ATPase